MSNMFSISRFGGYFLNDLNRSRCKYGINALIMGLMPVIFFVFYELIYFIASGWQWGNESTTNRIVCALVTLASLYLGYPVKAYGELTDRRAGTSFILTPASTFEKWLSMTLLGCVVLPLVVGILFFGTDFLLGTIFPEAYGKPLLGLRIGNELDAIFDLGGHHVGSIWLVLWLNWCANILAFTLGAIFFKRNKSLKTLLLLIALYFVTLMVFSAIAGDRGMDFADIESNYILLRKFFTIFYVFFTVQLTALLILLFVRLKNIKY